MRLKLILPELTQGMTKDLMDFLEISHIINEICQLPDDYYPDAELKAVKAIWAFLEGRETIEGLKSRLRAILEEFKSWQN